ncbi:MAG: sugar transferase [Elusimicrobia bacterium]|nr:sugar transferase [Elusimicrobiota bacterium]
MKRGFDIVLSLFALLLLALPMTAIALLVRLTSQGPALYWSDRVGRDNALFRMPKFRTMRLDVPEVATHLLPHPQRYVTPIGHLLRMSSLDELPQLYSILKGDMSFVGPRPALHNQDDLISLRTHEGIQRLVPGLTGWAQINGRDELTIPQKVALDEEYLRRRSFRFDLEILLRTACQALSGRDVDH